ncbi:MAG: sugar transferase [Thermodesulfovibrio sp.]|nr:sugar transferase [Thermodesulfovibrio sp.]
MFDLLFTLTFLPIIILFFTCIALVIKVTSSGPIIFTQQRVGKNGKLFKIYKFRTMHCDAEKKLKKILKIDPQAHKEWQEKRKLKNDPRITKIGRILRKTSLDELPQFINVIKGEMSIVGPRPYLPSEIRDLDNFSDIILSVSPGITGLWQVNGRSNTTFQERVLLDCQYVNQLSLTLDLKIIIKTVKVVLKGEGAY